MATTFKFVEPDDLSTVLLDLNALGASPSGTGFGYFDLDFGGLDPEVEWLRGDSDGSQQVARGNPHVTMTLRLYAKHTNYDALQSLVSTLADVLQSKGVIKWQPAAAAAARYIETYPSPVPALLRRETLLWQILNQGTDPIGIPLTIYRHPYFRSATVTGTPATLDHAVNAREIAVSNTGNRHGEAKVTVTPTAGNVAGIRFGIRAEGNLTEFSTLYSFACSGWTMKTDTSSAAVTDATGGNAAVITFATHTQLIRRGRKVITPSDTTALEGTFRAYARLIPQGGTTNSEFKVQLRYGFTTDDIVQISNDVVELDWRDVSTQNFVEIDIGLVTVPNSAAQLVLDFWASQESGDQNLAVDQIILIPADEQFVTASVPGFRMGSWGRERFDADELDGTGTLSRGTYRLNANGEIGRTFPTAGFSYPAGTHSFTADVSLRETPGASIEISRMEVYETTTSTIVKYLVLRNKKNQLWTRKERTLNWSVSAADVTAGKKYVLRVRQTAATASGRRTQIHDLTHRFLPVVTSSNSFVIDSLNRRAYVKTGTAASFPLNLEGEWPMAPPGGSRWVFQFIDATTDPGYQDVDEREAVGKSVLARAASVQIDVSPRGTH